MWNVQHFIEQLPSDRNARSRVAYIEIKCNLPSRALLNSGRCVACAIIRPNGGRLFDNVRSTPAANRIPVEPNRHPAESWTEYFGDRRSPLFGGFAAHRNHTSKTSLLQYCSFLDVLRLLLFFDHFSAEQNAISAAHSRLQNIIANSETPRERSHCCVFFFLFFFSIIFRAYGYCNNFTVHFDKALN